MPRPRNGHDEVVTVLLASGAMIEAQDTIGCAALHCAACRGRAEIVIALLAKGAMVEAVD